jgi:hypothetical protein
MEPLNDNELDRLLRKWEAPSAPPTLQTRGFSAQKPWWSWFWSGSIRIPVPVAVAAVLLLAIWLQYSRQPVSQQTPLPSTVSLRDFTPVPQLQPTLVSGGQK